MHLIPVFAEVASVILLTCGCVYSTERVIIYLFLDVLSIKLYACKIQFFFYFFGQENLV